MKLPFFPILEHYVLIDQDVPQRPRSNSNPDPPLLKKNVQDQAKNDRLSWVPRNFKSGYESDMDCNSGSNENSQKLTKTTIPAGSEAGTDLNPSSMNTRKTRPKRRPDPPLSLNLKAIPRRMSMSYSPTSMRKEILKEETEEKDGLSPLVANSVKMRPVKPPRKPPRKTLLRVSVMKT